MSKRLTFDILQIARGSLPMDQMPFQLGSICLIGGCSVSYLADKVKLDTLVNHSDIQSAVKETLAIIRRKLPELSRTIDILGAPTLTNEELTKIFVTLKASLQTLEQYAELFEELINQLLVENGKIFHIEMAPDFMNQLAIAIADPQAGSFYDGTLKCTL